MKTKERLAEFEDRLNAKFAMILDEFDKQGRILSNIIDKIEMLSTQDILSSIASAEASAARYKFNAEDLMRRLTDMMKELKGIICMVRPSAMKNDWYSKEEIDVPTQIPRRETICTTISSGKKQITTSVDYDGKPIVFTEK